MTAGCNIIPYGVEDWVWNLLFDWQPGKWIESFKAIVKGLDWHLWELTNPEFFEAVKYKTLKFLWELRVHAIHVKETVAEMRPVQFYADHKCSHSSTHHHRADEMKLHRDPVETCAFGQKNRQNESRSD